MNESHFTIEEAEAVKARIIRERGELERLGVEIAGISLMPSTNQVHVMVVNLNSAKSKVRDRYGDIVYLTEGTAESSILTIDNPFT